MKYIELKGVTKVFKDTRDKTINVLSKCDLYIEKGESIGILGANGSGKSTLLKIISGSETVSSGERIVKGNISWPVGVYSALLPNLTVDQNVNLGNIAPNDVLPLETLRLGLRGDTFFNFLPNDVVNQRKPH